MKRSIATIVALCAMPMFGQDAETYAPTVPLMLPASDSFVQSFVRIVNRSNDAGDVHVTAVDDGGNVYDTVTIRLAPRQNLHFNSGDLADGNASKGIRTGIGAPREGNWRLQIETLLYIDVLSYIRTRDGFLTAMHDVLPGYSGRFFVKTFNPASNTTQQSRLRLVNWGTNDSTVRIDAFDDRRNQYGPVEFTLPAGQSRMLTAVDLEEGAHGLEGTLGDGSGKWQFVISGTLGSMTAQNLLYTSSGHISNLSTLGALVGFDAVPLTFGVAHNTRLTTSTDIDWFRIDIRERGRVTIEFGQMHHFDVKWYRDDLTLAWEYEDLWSSFWSDGDARTMFLSVEGHDGRTGDYSVTATFEAED